MQKYFKTGLLMLTLVVPVLIFLFLKGFTTNRFDLPYFVPLEDTLSGGVAMSEGDTLFYQIRDFTLTTVQGQEITSAELKDKTIVLSTITLPCDDTCQKVVSQLERVISMRQSYPELMLVTFLKGSSREIQAAEVLSKARPSWLMIEASDSSSISNLNTTFRLNEKVPGQKTISSNNRLILLDKNRYIRGYYDAQDPEEIDRLLVEVKVLEYNRNEKN